MGEKGVKAEGRRQRTYPGAQGVGLGGGLQLGTGKEWEQRGTGRDRQDGREEKGDYWEKIKGATKACKT